MGPAMLPLEVSSLPSPSRSAPPQPSRAHVALVLKLSALTIALALIALLGGRAGARWLAAVVPTAPPSAAPSASERAPSPSPDPSSGSDARHAVAPSEPSEASAPSEGLLPDGRVVLNLASEAELGRVPGLGKKKAKAIVALRERRGRLHHLEELLEVKGIGRRALGRLRARVVLDR
jgi:competence ComEA-like helix-hairpin-helix protein